MHIYVLYGNIKKYSEVSNKENEKLSVTPKPEITN